MPEPDRPDRRELVFAGILIAVAVTVVLLALRIPPGVQTDPLGPRAFPLALGGTIGLCGVLLAATTLAPGWFTRAAPVFVEEGEEGPGGPGSPGRLITAVVLTVAYIAAFEPLGYLVATPIYVAALLLVQRARSASALVAAPLLVTAAFYAAFRFGLLIPVPDGVLERWLPW
jgi:putative tricarboxylic transport membrane protein